MKSASRIGPPLLSSRTNNGCVAICFIIITMIATLSGTDAFTSQRVMTISSTSQFMGQTMRIVRNNHNNHNNNKKRAAGTKSSTSLNMFLGSDGGLLGVGAPEVATILLVGYFVLGPSDLYKLTKEIGKFVQNIRSLSTEASKSFETSMESQLELDELRKAQRELNDAFSFRRSINIDEQAEAFSAAPDDERLGDEPIISTDQTGSTKPKRKIRRRKKKAPPPPQPEEIPDLEMPGDPVPLEDALKMSEEQARLEEEARLRVQRMERLEDGMAGSKAGAGNDWFADMPPAFEDSPAATDAAKPELGGSEAPAEITPDPAVLAAEQGRFAAQVNGNWNDQVMANEDKLSPLAKVMEKLAILEEEKQAADARLEEEFRLRAELEEKFYRERRSLLEEVATEVQMEAYADLAASGAQTEDAK